MKAVMRLGGHSRKWLMPSVVTVALAAPATAAPAQEPDAAAPAAPPPRICVAEVCPVDEANETINTVDSMIGLGDPTDPDAAVPLLPVIVGAPEIPSLASGCGMGTEAEDAAANATARSASTGVVAFACNRAGGGSDRVVYYCNRGVNGIQDCAAPENHTWEDNYGVLSKNGRAVTWETICVWLENPETQRAKGACEFHQAYFPPGNSGWGDPNRKVYARAYASHGGTRNDHYRISASAEY